MQLENGPDGPRHAAAAAPRLGPSASSRPESVLSAKQPAPRASRRDRRAADRRDRYDAARDERRAREARGGSPFTSGRLLTIGAIVAGVVLVAVVAASQLGGKVAGTFKDPQIEYPAGLIAGATIGKADAPVTLEVYGDFQCPICARYSLTVEPDLVASYVVPGTLRIVHHDIAILGNRTPDDESKIAAVGASCATDQGRYWDYAHWVYANQDGENNGGFARDRLTAIAQAAGVDVSAFPACLDDAERVVAVATATGDAGNLGINSTPTMAINGQLLQPGLPTTAALGGLIEAAAASASPGASPSASGNAPAAGSPVTSGSAAP